MRAEPDNVECPNCKTVNARHCQSPTCNWFPCQRCRTTLEGKWVNEPGAGRITRKAKYVKVRIWARLPSL